MEEVLPVCNQKNWSEQSMNKLLQAYVPEENSDNIGVEILELGDLTNGINIFA